MNCVYPSQVVGLHTGMKAIWSLWQLLTCTCPCSFGGSTFQKFWNTTKKVLTWRDDRGTSDGVLWYLGWWSGYSVSCVGWGRVPWFCPWRWYIPGMLNWIRISGVWNAGQNLGLLSVFIEPFLDGRYGLPGHIFLCLGEVVMSVVKFWDVVSVEATSTWMSGPTFLQ